MGPNLVGEIVRRLAAREYRAKPGELSLQAHTLAVSFQHSALSDQQVTEG